MPKLLAILLLLISFALPINAMTVMCTAYTSYESGGIMANGMWIQEGYVACDFLPLGTVVYINGQRYVVGDRIGDGSYNHVDIVFDDYNSAVEFGVRYLEMEVE